MRKLRSKYNNKALKKIHSESINVIKANVKTMNIMMNIVINCTLQNLFYLCNCTVKIFFFYLKMFVFQITR